MPNYTIGDDAYDFIETICSPYGKNAVVIGGEKSILYSKDFLLKSLREKRINILGFVNFGQESSYENVDILKNNKEVKEADMIFAFGGGKSIDTSKTLGEIINIPVFTFPTIASNCAPVTRVSVMYDSSHVFKDLFFQKMPPKHTFINTNIILNSPKKYFLAGIGDAMSKQYESLFSSRGDILDYNDWLGIEIGKNCSSDILMYGEKALKDMESKNMSFDFIKTVLHIIVTTGLVSVCVIDDYNTSLAHALYYGFTQIKNIEENYLHGFIVFYGILVLLTLDEQLEERNKVFNFGKKISLPFSLKTMGVDVHNLDIIIENVLKTSDMEHTPYKITKDMIYNAIINLENYSKNT